MNKPKISFFIFLSAIIIATLASCEIPQEKPTNISNSYPLLTIPNPSAYPVPISPTPNYSRYLTQTPPIYTEIPSPTATKGSTTTPTLFPRSDGWVEFRNSQIGYVVAFPLGSHFDYSMWPPNNSGLFIDEVLIWFKAENVSPGLAVLIETIKNPQALSAEEYFASHGNLPKVRMDISIKNATVVNFQGISGVKFVTMAIADQYIILVSYKEYLVELTVLYGGPAGPFEMTSSNNQFMNVFLSRFSFKP